MSQKIKIIIALFFVCYFPATYAQYTWVKVGVDGLTCSQCSRSVEMSLRKLDFVQDVQMNLEHTEGTISFKKASKVDVERIAQAVVNAGFSVRFLTAGYVFNKVCVTDNHCYQSGEDQFQFINSDSEINGETTLHFLGKEFMPLKEYKKKKKQLSTRCGNPKGKTFFVSL